MGSGKGVYTVIKTIEELQDTDRHIITNFAYRINPWVRKIGKRKSRGEKGFKAHLLDTCGEDYNIEKRIHIIPDEDMANFYLWRINDAGELIKLDGIYDKRSGKLEGFDPEAFEKTQPCVYVVDEAQRFWSARDWQKTSDALSFYVTQHRKATDDVWVACQHLSQLDKQMRVLFQEYHTCVNHKFRKMSVFKQPNVISVIVSNEAPEQRVTNLGHLPKIIRFDPLGIGSCYDTASGVGVQGRAADILQKPKGLPWWGIFALVILGGLLIIVAAKGLGIGVGKLLTGGFNKPKPVKIEPAQPVQKNKVLDPFGLAPLELQPRPQPKLESYSPVTNTEPEVFMVGFAMIPHGLGDEGFKPKREFKIMLSNGRVYSTYNPSVTYLDEYIAIINNKTYRMKTWTDEPKQTSRQSLQSRQPSQSQ